MARKRTVCTTTEEEIVVDYSLFRTAGFSVVDYQIGSGGNILSELWNINPWRTDYKFGWGQHRESGQPVSFVSHSGVCKCLYEWLCCGQGCPVMVSFAKQLSYTLRHNICMYSFISVPTSFHPLNCVVIRGFNKSRLVYRRLLDLLPPSVWISLMKIKMVLMKKANQYNNNADDHWNF